MRSLRVVLRVHFLRVTTSVSPRPVLRRIRQRWSPPPEALPLISPWGYRRIPVLRMRHESLRVGRQGGFRKFFTDGSGNLAAAGYQVEH
ncbi:MAG: hypothetical protein MPJ50_10715 [Pirellulales bacterium]|nr:hypothetical protein [Pirellulales bacterium]